MKTKVELEQEYINFKEKVFKTFKDFTDAVNGLSPENYKRFKIEMLSILPAGFVNLLKTLNE